MLLGLNYGIMKQISFDKLPCLPVLSSLFRRSQVVCILTTLTALFALTHLGFSLRESGWFAFLIYVEAVMILLLSFYRATSAVGGYATGSITKALAFLAFLMLAGFGSRHSSVHVSDVLFWRLSSASLAIAFSMYVFKTRKFTDSSSVCPDGDLHSRHLYSDAIRYGAPFLVTGLLTMVIDFADRYILKAFFDYTVLAHYVIYSKIAAFLNPLIIAPLGLWWPTERFKRLRNADGGMLFFRQTALKVLIVLLLVGGALWLFSPGLITLFAPGVVAEPRIQLMLIASVVFMGMGAPLNIGLLNSGKTHLNIYGVLGGAVIHLLLCILLIPTFGATGAALSTALSYLAYTLLLNVLSQRLIPVPFAYLAMLSVVVIAFGELLLFHSLSGDAGLFACALRSAGYALTFAASGYAVYWFSTTMHNKTITGKNGPEICAGDEY